MNPNREVYIVAHKRTPIGSFCGSLSNYSGPDLASFAIKGALQSIQLNPQEIDEVYLGNVCSANIGQNPARQASLLAGLSKETPCTTVNKVCASGMKTVQLGAISIMCGECDCVLAGGFESMSNIPFYVENHRKGQMFGSQTLHDGLQKDGLTDFYNKKAMGFCAEKTASDFQITREQNDQFCVNSYEKAKKALVQKGFANEIVPIQLKNGQILESDEEPGRFKPSKLGKLKPVFKDNGTITAANASKINDGACAIILMSWEKLQKLGLKPLAKIVSFADAEVEPVDFCIAPSKSGEKALKKAKLELHQMDLFEFNEAFSTTVLANIKLLNINDQKVNIQGGAVALGHPLGMSGARIIGALINNLKQTQGKYGMAGICNGGGGGSSIIIENLM